MNRLLITPQEVLDRAFCSGEYLPPERISEELILAATERYIRPVTGVRLLEAMASGAHADLKSDFLLPALCLFLKIRAQRVKKLQVHFYRGEYIAVDLAAGTLAEYLVYRVAEIYIKSAFRFDKLLGALLRGFAL